MTDDFLFVNRLKHTLHGCLNILNCLVDDTVQTDVYAVLLCHGFCVRIRAYVKSDNDGGRCGCQHNVGLVDRTDTAVDDAYGNFLVGEFDKTLFYCLDRSLYIGFDNECQFF